MKIQQNYSQTQEQNVKIMKELNNYFKERPVQDDEAELVDLRLVKETLPQPKKEPIKDSSDELMLTLNTRRKRKTVNNNDL